MKCASGVLQTLSDGWEAALVYNNYLFMCINIALDLLMVLSFSFGKGTPNLYQP